MESIVIKQNDLIKSFVQIESNFKKDSTYRKTAGYFVKKLEALDQLWEEFQHNHLEICEYQDIQNHQYIVEDVYTKTEEHYQSIKNLIINQQQKLSDQSQSQLVKQPESQQQSTSSNKGEGYQGKSVSEQRISSRGAYSRCDEMLRKQSANFKAFERTMASINLDSLSDKWEFEDALKSLQTRWATVDSLHWEIYSEQNVQNPEYEAAFNQYEQSFIKMKREINKKLWSVSYRDKSTPQMEIPEFSGQFNQWVSFKDLFNEAIHINRALSSAQKMQFLKAKVKGEAERLIQHLTISSDNYQVCWEILNNRYNNKKLIFTSHANTLLGFQNMQQQSLGQIKKLHDLTLESLHGIKNLDIDISTWDPIIVHILSQKLDNATYGDYIESLDNSRDLPNLNDFLKFLESKFTILESSRRKHDLNQQKPTFPPINQGNAYKKSNYNNRFQGNYYNSTAKPFMKSMPVQAIKCPLCYNDHGIFNCNKFLEMQPEMKLKTISRLQYCINCLYSHNGNPCYSQRRCRDCTGQHNTLLHPACVKIPTGPKATGSHYNQPRQMNSGNYFRNKHANNTSNVSLGNNAEILLATAMITVNSIDGTQIIMRALIDQGSQVSLITENAAQTLGIKRQKCQGTILGVGAKENNSKGLISITCSSIYEDFTFDTDVIIMNNLVKHLPNQTFQKPAWSYLENIKLADPEFNVSREIDILFGADIYSMIMLGGIIRGEDQVQPIVQQTRIGWIICGSIEKSFQCNIVLNNVEDIQRFWALEEVTEPSDMTSEDQKCVDFYMSTTRRRSDGRYEVKLPMVENFEEKIGSSKQMAIAQFLNLEKKFRRELQLSKLYKEFIKEYQTLGHMELCTSNANPEYYLPHHAVQRAESLTCKLRVVYNAGNKSSTGHSLNDLMYRGPNLQQDLQSLILKWRQHKYVFTADIEKMFRGIMIQEEDRSLQKIIWRDNPQQPLQSYQLTTVSYGMKAAPFLAMMTLRKLATDEREQFQEAASILEECFYTDDLIHGTQTVEHGKQLVGDLNQLLKKGGFTLRKWSSNNPELLSELNNMDQEQTVHHFKTDDRSKILGLGWNSKDDTFNFTCNMSKQFPPKLTKRLLLSEISKLFDPLGWLAPVVVKLKLFFQEIYNLKLNWDDAVPQSIQTEWIKLRSDVDNIIFFKISRWTGSTSNENMELHGFCDASEKAYACVVYARIIKDDQVKITLIAAKTKLVPKKKEVSLPKLELSGALLLSRLIRKIGECLNIPMSSAFGWSDSMVVLGWLQGSPERWKPFVKNRVTSITQVVDSNNWRYVKSAENPADSASRGISAAQLKENTLWFNGPQWLQSRQIDQSPKNFMTNHEIKITQSNVIQVNRDESIIEKLIQKHSCINSVIRVIAWLLRALNPRRNLLPRYITLHELRKANLLVIKQVQRSEFEEDINHLIKHNKLHHKSKLLNLNPVLDENGLLRVGGRLKKSNLDQEMKHPLIIPHSSRITDLLIDQAHHLTFHGGARLTLSAIRMKYWIIGGNRAVKKRVRNCIICRKQNKEIHPQIMGDLPEARVTPSPPFYHTGVDYTGFIDIKANKGRGVKTTKGYIALFVCMVTKAVHLELVSDLTSSAFLASLKRMAARKRAPKHLYSDQGTNFIGASRKINEEYVELQKIFNDSFYKEIAELNIEWHFNAPSWPSAGGLWERAVRSLKYHMKRVIGDQKLTFEELSTILAQLEACLNARPLCALSEDVEDLDALTPAHFLYGDAGLTVIETEQDARTRWHLIRKLHQEIWQRWKTEYLTQLSARGKWLKPHQNIEIGSLVLIQDDIIPAGKWPLGRVINVHPGADGYVRVVTIKTKNGILKRPLTRLSVLPLQSDKENINQRNESAEKTDQSNEDKKQSRKRSPSTLVSIALALLFFMSMISGYNCAYNVTTLPQNQSIYFDPITKMQLVRDDWTLIVYYDLSSYWEGIRAFENITTYLNQTCATTEQNNHCTTIILQLIHDYRELQYYNQIMLSRNFSARATRRSRRGYINAVGRITNTLFGILDDNFAEQYKRDIEEIRNNESHLIRLWKNQTSVIETGYNLLKKTKEIMDSQHKIIYKHLESLDKIANNLQLKVTSWVIFQEFSLASITASNLLQNLRRIQSDLLNTITDIYHGQVNIHLLSPEQLLKEFSIISSQLPKELTLPIDTVQADIPKIYKLMKCKAKMLQQYLIIEIKIPILSRDSFELYKPISIPHQSKKNMIQIMPISEYIAINFRKDTYLPINNEELQECQYHDQRYFCHLDNPIYHLSPTEKFCNLQSETGQCKISKSVCKNQWIKLYESSSYFYFCCDTYHVRIICDDAVTPHQLNGFGIISLGQRCEIKGDDFTLFAHQSHLSSMLNTGVNVYAPKMLEINHIINITLPIDDPVDHLNETDLDWKSKVLQLNKQIEQMKNGADTADVGLSSHDVHQYAVSYLAVAAAVAAGAALAWWRCRPRTPRAPRAPLPDNTDSASVSARKCFQAEQPSVSPLQCIKTEKLNACVSDSVRVINKSERQIRQFRDSSENINDSLNHSKQVNIATSPILTKVHFHVSD